MISVYDVQVGDVMLLEAGDILCADGILITGSNVKCDESLLTGESEFIKKNRENPFLVSGSTVSEGEGRYIVTAVGPNSFNGKILMGM